MKTRHFCGALAGVLMVAAGCGEVVITEGDGGSLFDNGGADSGGASSAAGSGGTSGAADAGGAASGGMSSGGAESGGADAGTGGSDPGPLMCDPEDPELSTCDMCVQTSCCDEIIGCSNSVECSGEIVPEDQAIMGEYGCILDEIQAMFDALEAEGMDSGFTDEMSIADAMETCRLEADGMLLTEETTDLLTCIVGEDGNGPCAPDCFDGYIAPIPE